MKNKKELTLRIVVLSLVLLISMIGFSQEKDEDLSFVKEKREMLIQELNSSEPKVYSSKFSYDNDNLIISTMQDFDEKDYEGQDIPKLIMLSCFSQLHFMVSVCKIDNGKAIDEAGFENVLFKTNVIGNEITRRYHFLFSLSELKSLPEYIDKYELFQYAVIENESKNIVLSKNPNKF